MQLWNSSNVLMTNTNCDFLTCRIKRNTPKFYRKTPSTCENAAMHIRRLPSHDVSEVSNLYDSES